MLSVYMGIDVACASGKRLPICVVSPGRPLTPLVIPKHLAAEIPRGLGNREITAAAPFEKAAREVVGAVRRIEIEMGWRIERIAVDAPAAPPERAARASETELGRHGLSCFRTPSKGTWAAIHQQCAEHIRQGGTIATLPHANKIWMLFGFALFAQLRSDLHAEVIEVYPFAIVHELLSSCEHKSTDKGYRDQLDAVAARTGWDDPQKLEASLKATVPGSRHDRLDAFMAAWVASLPVQQRRAIGDANGPDDAIWVPL